MARSAGPAPMTTLTIIEIILCAVFFGWVWVLLARWFFSHW
jgi:hypothetical protein